MANPITAVPYASAAILSPDVADDNKFKQWIYYIEQAILAASWAEVLDAGYCQPWAQAMAFSTASNNNAGVTTGGTSAANPANYPAAAMDGSTATFWQAAGQPVLGGVGYAVGYDAGVGNTLSPIYMNLWLQGAQNQYDPYSFVLEYADVMDVNGDWALATWTPVLSEFNVSTTAGNLSCAGATVSAAGSGYVINTIATMGGAAHGIGAVLQPVITAGGIGSVLIADPGIGYQVGDPIVFTPASSTGVTAATGWTVGSVNAAGQITSISAGTVGAGYVANPICTASNGTGTSVWAVFTNAGVGAAALGVAGGVAQVIPCVCNGTSGGNGYAYGTPPTLTITQTTGGSSPTGATATAKLTMSTSNAAQLNRYDIPTQWWASLSATAGVGPTHRAFRTRILSNNGGTTAYVYETQFMSYSGVYYNQSPPRLAPSTVSTHTPTCWKVFQMQDANNAACPIYLKVWFGSGATWNYPALWLQMGPGTDGAGNLVGQQTTGTNVVGGSGTGIEIASAAGSPTAAPFWCNGYTNWLHMEMFKGTSAELIVHVERLQTTAGADDPTQGAALLVASTALARSVVCPQTGQAPSIETSWGAYLGTVAGSINGATNQIANITCNNHSQSNPLRHMWICQGATYGFVDGSTPNITDAYGNNVQAYVGGVNCATGVTQTSILNASPNTNGRCLTRNTTGN